MFQCNPTEHCGLSGRAAIGTPPETAATDLMHTAEDFIFKANANTTNGRYSSATQNIDAAMDKLIAAKAKIMEAKKP